MCGANMLQAYDMRLTVHGLAKWTELSRQQLWRCHTREHHLGKIRFINHWSWICISWKWIGEDFDPSILVHRARHDSGVLMRGTTIQGEGCEPYDPRMRSRPQ